MSPESKVEKLAEKDCDACAGTGEPISGRPCMCGGTGYARDAVVYLRATLWNHREALVKAEQLIEATLEELHCYSANDNKSREEMGAFAWGHWCSACDDYTDRNGTLRAELRAALKQIQELTK